MTATTPRLRARAAARGVRQGVVPLVLALALSACGAKAQQAPAALPGPGGSPSAEAAASAPAPVEAAPAPAGKPGGKAPNPLKGVRSYASMVEQAAEIEFYPASTGRAGTGIALGEMGAVSAPVGVVAPGRVRTAVANIPNRTSAAGFASSVRFLVSGRPDVVVLNELGRRSLTTLRALAPGYAAYRDPVADPTLGGSQSLNNVVMWRADRWNLVDGGRVKVVDDDRGFFRGRPFVWDRYLTWAVLQDKRTGAVLPVVATHLPTNPARFPQQPGRPAVSRVERYAAGVDRVGAVAAALSRFGPVLIGGDMNSFPGQGAWTAAARINARGFGYAKDSGVMYLFHPPGSSVVAHRQARIASDHPAILTTVDLPYAAVPAS